MSQSPLGIYYVKVGWIMRVRLHEGEKINNRGVAKRAALDSGKMVHVAKPPHVIGQQRLETLTLRDKDPMLGVSWRIKGYQLHVLMIANAYSPRRFFIPHSLTLPLGLSAKGFVESQSPGSS